MGCNYTWVGTDLVQNLPDPEIQAHQITHKAWAGSTHAEKKMNGSPIFLLCGFSMGRKKRGLLLLVLDEGRELWTKAMDTRKR